MPHKHDFLSPSDTFEYLRLPDLASLPAADDRNVDIAILDMNHSWPNLGHDSIVQIVREASDALRPQLREASLRTRVISFDVRQRLLVPKHDGRFLLYIGTGGPGHLDPRENDGVAEGSQGISEDPSWEAPLFTLFDETVNDRDASLLAICHSFGLMCRWSGIAEARLRGPEKGGKSSGIVDAILSHSALGHPWFTKFAEELRDRRFKVLDNRLYDLVPTGKLPYDEAMAFATLEGEIDRDALTMVEFARDENGAPRVFAVNHHPEIIDRAHVMRVLDEKLDRGEVTADWYEERASVFRDEIFTPSTERDLRRTSRYTFIDLVSFHLQRIVRARSGVAV